MMKISEAYPQFPEKTLIVASGAEHAMLYIAHQGYLSDGIEIVSDPRKYTDNAGRFETRGHGRTFNVSQVYHENEKDIREKSFFRRLAHKIRNIVKDEKIKTVYLFVPSYVRHNIPKELSKYNVIFIAGENYSKEHPFVLLKRISFALL